MVTDVARGIRSYAAGPSVYRKKGASVRPMINQIIIHLGEVKEV